MQVIGKQHKPIRPQYLGVEDRLMARASSGAWVPPTVPPGPEGARQQEFARGNDYGDRMGFFRYKEK